VAAARAVVVAAKKRVVATKKIRRVAAAKVARAKRAARATTIMANTKAKTKASEINRLSILTINNGYQPARIIICIM